MRLHWENSTTTIIVEYSNGERKECSAALWSRIGGSLNNNIFNSINQYWESRPYSEIIEWETIYRNIFDIFDRYLDPLQTIQLLNPLIDRLFQLMEWNKFRIWAILHGNISLSNGIKDTLDDKDKAGLTYYTKDYEDLMVFSIMLKPIMPIWGVFHEEYTEIIGKYFVHISAINLIKTHTFINLLPVLKLEDYIDHFTKNKIKKVGFSLISGIGTEEIPTFLLALALIKKVVVYDVSDTSGSIVKNVYHLLTERCTEITKVRPNEKKNIDNEGSDISISDRYKIIQRIPPSVSAMIDYYGENIYNLAKGIDPTIPDDLINKYIQIPIYEFEFYEYHLPLLAVICKRILKGRSLNNTTYQTIINLLKASAAATEHWGYLEISELLLTIPTRRDMYQISSSITGNRSYNLLLPHLSNEINKMYQYQSNNRNPGINLIENVIKEVIKYDWKVTSNNFVNLRNSIAQLLLKQLGGDISVCTC